ncbi:MAG: hypothetical protein RMY64_06635 [Nostoc sp. DedQUE08]|uniref:hypothetical protein n=2 Tax=Nostoc TaxID=1177 RepID=UPI002AD564DD|nr:MULTISPECIES: hypothetical protein [unclassified Nostoc]MDZ8065303.1 hypothetical protein [Nostoc sp. DedQUE08]MDZ8091905.1 hypothetical protein [Nostoc sp. DedQUE05]MDZ8128380.1 hypothetical protein [Nostoc sp. DedQUE07]
MPKSIVQRIAMPKVVRFAAIAFSSVAVVLTTCQSAFAQLNVGRYGIQQGLESEYLQYQINNQNLSRMRVIPGCDVGFGLTCNKTGSVIQRLVELNNGTSYQNLLIRAAGGEKNFQNFASFYGNNPNLSAVPYASFWRNASPAIMDGSQYLLGQPFGRNPVEGLGLVTKQFYWAPYSGVNDSVSLRNGLLDLKLSYGRLLFEEASKISNIQEQIQSLGLSPEMTNFYLDKISTGLDALSSGNQNQLQQKIFEVLSFPYSEDGGELGRPNNAIPAEFNQLLGEDIAGDTLLSENPLPLDGETIAFDAFPGSTGDVLVPESSGSFPLWPIIGVGGLGLILLLLLSGDSSSAQPSVSSSQPPVPVSPENTPLSLTNKGECDLTPSGNSSDHTQIVEIPCNVTPQTPTEVKKVVEPSTIKALVLIIVLLWIVRNKHRTLKIRHS